MISKGPVPDVGGHDMQAQTAFIANLFPNRRLQLPTSAPFLRWLVPNECLQRNRFRKTYMALAHRTGTIFTTGTVLPAHARRCAPIMRLAPRPWLTEVGIIT